MGVRFWQPTFWLSRHSSCHHGGLAEPEGVTNGGVTLLVDTHLLCFSPYRGIWTVPPAKVALFGERIHPPEDGSVLSCIGVPWLSRPTWRRADLAPPGCVGAHLDASWAALAFKHLQRPIPTNSNTIAKFPNKKRWAKNINKFVAQMGVRNKSQQFPTIPDKSRQSQQINPDKPKQILKHLGTS